MSSQNNGIRFFSFQPTSQKGGAPKFDKHYLSHFLLCVPTSNFGTGEPIWMKLAALYRVSSIENIRSMVPFQYVFPNAQSKGLKYGLINPL